MNKSILSLLVFFLFSNLLNAQDIQDVFRARDDASVYVKHYMGPAMNGLMYNLNNGWYTTGKTHEKFGFDITISASAAMIPEAQTTFKFDPAEYSEDFYLQSGGSATLPTVVGGTTDEVIETSYGSDLVSFDAIDGVGEQWKENIPIDMPIAVPSPMIQIGLGLPTNTDIKLRFFPKTTTEGVESSLFGVGVQHNLSQYIKTLDDIAGFSVSGLGAFTKAKVAYIPHYETGDVEASEQSIEMSVNSYTLQVIGDYNLKFINFYLGMGYTGGNTNLGAYGDYKYDNNENGTIEPDEIVTDPISIDFSVAGFKTTIGTRFNLGPVKLFGAYTIQKYPSITAGIAVSIR